MASFASSTQPWQASSLDRVMCSPHTAVDAALDAQGRPGVVALAFLVGAWGVSVPLAYIFSFTLDQGVEGLWRALVAGYAVVTIVVGVAVLRSDWKALSKEAYVRSESKAAALAAATPVADKLNAYAVVPSPAASPSVSAASALSPKPWSREEH